MIITCSQCQTRFRVDDALIKETGTRVRCSSCQSVFTVFLPRAGGGAQERSRDAIPRPPAQSVPRAPADEAPIPQAPVPRAPEPQRTFTARPLPPAERDFYIPDAQDDDACGPAGYDERLVPASAQAADPRRHELSEDAAPASAAGARPGATADPRAAAPRDAQAPSASRPAPGGMLDEGRAPDRECREDDPGLGGDPLASDPAAYDPLASDPLASDPLASGPAASGPVAPGQDQRDAAYGPAREPGEDFGGPAEDFDDLEITPRAASVFGPPPQPSAPAPQPARSRLLRPRERRPRDRRVLGLAAAVAAALLTAGLYFYFSVDSSPEPGVAVQSVAPDPGTPLEGTAGASASAGGLSGSATPGTGPQVDTAALTQPDVPNSTEHLNFSRDMTTHHYRSNSEAGNILIVTGRVENHFPDRRSYIKVKAVLKDSKGTVVAERDAFAGNYLTESELTTLPMSEILARLALRGGQNSSNINVAPGSSVPFMLVFDKLPSDLAEYVVECLSSTPAGDVAETSRAGTEAVS